MTDLLINLSEFSSTLFSPFSVKEANTKGRVNWTDRGTFTPLDHLSMAAGISDMPRIQGSPNPFQEMLRMKWRAALAKARELEEMHPDPIQEMIDLLGNVPGDYDTWREIIEEPYG